MPTFFRSSSFYVLVCLHTFVFMGLLSYVLLLFTSLDVYMPLCSLCFRSLLFGVTMYTCSYFWVYSEFSQDIELAINLKRWFECEFYVILTSRQVRLIVVASFIVPKFEEFGSKIFKSFKTIESLDRDVPRETNYKQLKQLISAMDSLPF